MLILSKRGLKKEEKMKRCISEIYMPKKKKKVSYDPTTYSPDTGLTG